LTAVGAIEELPNGTDIVPNGTDIVPNGNDHVANGTELLPSETEHVPIETERQLPAMVLEPISTVTDAGSDDPFSPIDEGGETSVIRNMFYMTDSLDEESYRCYSKSYFYGERQVCHEAGQD